MQQEVLVVVQGNHSLQVAVSDILKYPKSFLALCLSSPNVQRDKDGAVIVQERNVERFALVSKYYSSGKVKISNTSLDLEMVRNELSFWFPGENLHIQYKDPLVDLAYKRKRCAREYLAKNFSRTEREEICMGLMTLARAGYLDFRVETGMDRFGELPPFESAIVYYELVTELFPTDRFSIEWSDLNYPYHLSYQSSPEIILNVSWKIDEGNLGSITGAKAKEKSKLVLQKLFHTITENWGKPYCHIPLSEIWETEIPAYFHDFFMEYIDKKSKHNYSKASTYSNNNPIIHISNTVIHCDLIKLRDIL